MTNFKFFRLLASNVNSEVSSELKNRWLREMDLGSTTGRSEDLENFRLQVGLMGTLIMLTSLQSLNILSVRVHILNIYWLIDLF